jgi:prophage tail gpP-like protein
MNNLKLEEIIKKLCSTFKVPLKVLAKTELVPDFSMQCESPANALINAARAANLLLYPSADGGIVLTEPTKDAPVATLVYGDHILSYEVVDEYKLRFSEYTVKGFDHEKTESTKGSVKDESFSFFRPMQIMADKQGKGIGGCDRRAQLERNRRKARAHRIDLEVQGWKHPKGLWAINTQVRVIIPLEGIDAVFLIGDRAFNLDSNGGSITRLQVMNREAFVGEAVKDDKKSATGKAKSHKAKRGHKHTPKTVINPGE